jgi:hypothetical protein
MIPRERGTFSVRQHAEIDFCTSMTSDDWLGYRQTLSDGTHIGFRFQVCFRSVLSEK